MIVLSEAAISALVVAAVTLPVLGALVVVFLGARRLVVLGTLSAMPSVLLGVLAPAPGVEIDVDWLLLGARFGVDAHSAPFALLTGTLWTAASIACAGYFESEARRRIAPWWMLTLAGSVGLVLALDPITFFLFFALMSFAAYGLVVHRGDVEALRAGRIYMWYAVAGEVALFSGLVFAGTHSAVSGVLVLTGFGIKAGALLLHSWLPLAHGAAPAPASAVLSGAMLKAGLIGWLRFVDPNALWLEPVGFGLVLLGVAGAWAGALAGIAQSKPKVVLAYSSVSQMGIAVAAFGMLLAGDIPAPAAAAACALFALHHALAKGALFIGVGMLERLSGRARSIGLTVMALPALALIGAPFTSGATAKAEIKALAAGLPETWASGVGLAMPLAAVGTSLLMLRLFATLGSARERHCPAALWMPALALAIAGFAVPATFGQAASWAGFGAALAPIVVALSLVAAWRWLAGAPVIRVPSGDLATVLETLLATGSRRLSAPASPHPSAIDATRSGARGVAALRLVNYLENRLSLPRTSAAVTVALAAVLGAVLVTSG